MGSRDHTKRRTDRPGWWKREQWWMRHVLMLVIFILTDLALLWCFGGLFLDGMEFTSLQIFRPDSENGFPGNEHIFFSWRNYAKYCTFPCVLEDIVIAVIVFAADFRCGKKRGMTETIYFWIIHVAAKLLLNVHATAMFLGVLTYSRKSLWETMSPLAPTFGERLTLPESPFSIVTASLALALCVLVISFSILLFYADWRRHPVFYISLFALDIAMFPLWSDSTNWKQKAIGLGLAGLVILVAVAARMILKSDRGGSKGTRARNILKGEVYYEGKWDLYAVAQLLDALFIAFTACWTVVGLLHRKDQMNSLFGFQYSAIIKLLVPIFLVGNWMFRSIERRDPDRYLQHGANVYLRNTLTMIGFSCCVLMLFGEFGSVVCILLLTIAMMLLYMNHERYTDAADGRKHLLVDSIISVVIGVGISIAVMLAENTVFQWLTYTCTEADEPKMTLNGAFLGIDLASKGMFVLGIIAGAVLVIPVAVMVSIRGLQVILRFAGIFLRLIGKEDLAVSLRAFLANERSKRSGKITLGAKGRSATDVLDQIDESASGVMIWLVLLIVSLSVLAFNFKLKAYDGRTILQGYYMTAGRFSSTYEITPNVTEERTEEAKKAKKAKEAYDEYLKSLELGVAAPTDPAPTEAIPESVMDAAIEKGDKEGKEIKGVREIAETERTWETLKRYYAPRVYTDKLHREVMRLIDRLCFSSKTSELSAVQMGMRQNMGFQLLKDNSHIGYIPTLQIRYYVSKSRVDQLKEEGRMLYFDEAGMPREGIHLLNSSQEEPESPDETLYIWVDDMVPAYYQVTYDDNSNADITGEKEAKTRVFREAEPTTAVSDYVIYTLSRMGVGNVLLAIFIPYLMILAIMLFVNGPVKYQGGGMVGAVHYMLRGLSTLYAISFVIQAIVIVTGVCGIGIFSGLSTPLVAAGNCEMTLNCMCTAVMMISAADFSYTRKE